MTIKFAAKKEEVPPALAATAFETADKRWAYDEPEEVLGDKGEGALVKLRLERKAEKDRADKAEADLLKVQKDKEALEKGVTREQLDKIQADADAKANPVITKLTEENAAMKAANRQRMLKDQLESKLKDAGVMDDRLRTARNDLIAEGLVDLTDDEKDFVVKNAKGEITTTKLEAFLGGEWKEKNKFMFKGVDSSGSGSDGSLGGGPGGLGDGAAEAVAAGKAAAAAQKASTNPNSQAFK